jgi:hypothetical protein
MYSPTTAFEKYPCTIYTLTGAHESHVQLQRCSSCSRRFIGPDPREFHLFNFNNRIILTHELLDEYTSMYTSSETPFVAWVTTLSRRYQQRQSPRPFLGEDLFRTIWFAYVRLQHLETKDECPVCGPIPNDTIWDGITLAFSQKHLLPSLCPPTLSSNKSLRRENVRYCTAQQLLTDSKLRKAIRKVILGRSLVLRDGNDSGNEELHGGNNMSEKAANELLERIDSIPDVCDRLSNVNGALGRLFATHFGISALSLGCTPPAVYQRLFVQVCLPFIIVVLSLPNVSQLTAEESVLQMANKSALSGLANFVINPSPVNASRLVGIPSLYEVLSHHEQKNEPYPEDVLSLCNWVYARGQEVLNKLMVNNAPPLDEEANISNNWQTVSSIKIIHCNSQLYTILLEWLPLQYAPGSSPSSVSQPPK